jgi:hypothetical protein
MENPKTNRPNEPFRITGEWKYQLQQLKNKYNQLTDDDLKFKVGGEEDLLKRIGARLQRSRMEVIKLIQKEQVSRAL